MRRSALAVALLLATAPVAGAAEVTPDVKPVLRAVEVAAPSIRQDVVVAPAHAEPRSSKAAVQDRQGRSILYALAVIGVIALIGLLLI